MSLTAHFTLSATNVMSSFGAALPHQLRPTATSEAMTSDAQAAPPAAAANASTVAGYPSCRPSVLRSSWESVRHEQDRVAGSELDDALGVVDA